MMALRFSILNVQPESQIFNRLFWKCHESITVKVVSFNFKYSELCNS